jgi:hypothetical protein
VDTSALEVSMQRAVGCRCLKLSSRKTAEGGSGVPIRHKQQQCTSHPCFPLPPVPSELLYVVMSACVRCPLRYHAHDGRSVLALLHCDIGGRCSVSSSHVCMCAVVGRHSG